MAEIARYKERKSDGSVLIHAGNYNGDDRTLCGVAEEGSCVGDDSDSEIEPVSRGRINCEDCVAAILHCKAIPMKLVRRIYP